MTWLTEVLNCGTGDTAKEHRRVGTHIGRQAKALSIRQRQELVVIQHGVQVLHPLGVHIAIKDNPLAFLQLTSHIVYDPSLQKNFKGLLKSALKCPPSGWILLFV
jgi:hypothetical protein